MFHDQHVFHKWHVFIILFLMFCPEPPMGISSVGSFTVQSGGSLIIFQLFRCRNLALNRMFPTLEAGMGVVSLGGIYTTICLCPLYNCTPHTSIHPHTPCMSYVLCCLYVMGAWGHLYIPYVLGSFGGISTSLRHFSVCQYIHCLSVNNSHASCFPSFGLLLTGLDAPMDVLYASCCCSFLCSFIMSQASTTMVITSTPPVTVVSSGTSSLPSTVTMAPSLMGFQHHQVSMMWFCHHH